MELTNNQSKLTPPISFEFVHPKDIRSVWWFVKPGLENVLNKSKEAWIPEDIYAEAKAGTAFIYVASNGLGFIGGFVIKPTPEGLLVWAAWGEAGYRQDAFQWLQAEARRIGAHRIFFETNRRGWDKIAPKFGFRPRVWVVEV